MPRAPTIRALHYLRNTLYGNSTFCISSTLPRSSLERPILYRHFSTTSFRRNKKPYYITTPIFYVNAAPHVGHLYSLVLTDILKRWQTLLGRNALLSTGTDEHGMKIQRAASRAGSDPKAFCDYSAEIFKSLATKANISNDFFIRTTDPAHKDAVQFAWTKLQENDYIYLSKHEGWYSVSDETFYPQNGVQLIVDPPTGRKIMVSIETGKDVEWTSEINYRFRLSAFRDRLLQFYEDNPSFIVPPSRMRDVIVAVTSGLEDLSISRPSERLRWGVPVPTDDTQTIYVWLDALINYATVAGYPFTPGQESAKGWPADLHVIGKEIVRFHCIYWPAFLMALNLPLPRQVLTHAFWTLGREKMAKSTGNVVNPFFAIDRFGVDPIRYYLAIDGGIVQDSDYGNEFIIERYKKGLQYGLGNLASRIVRGKGWNVRRAVARATSRRFAFLDLDTLKIHHNLLGQVKERASAEMASLDVSRALKTIMEVIYKTNAVLSQVQPWVLAKQSDQASKDHLDSVIFVAAEALRITGILLQPFMPGKMMRLLDMLGVDESRRTIDFASPGTDKTYGESKLDVGKGHIGVLFPPLSSES